MATKTSLNYFLLIVLHIIYNYVVLKFCQKYGIIGISRMVSLRAMTLTDQKCYLPKIYNNIFKKVLLNAMNEMSDPFFTKVVDDMIVIRLQA